MRERNGKKRSTELNSTSADCVQSHGAFWQSNVVLSESETRNVGAV